MTPTPSIPLINKKKDSAGSPCRKRICPFGNLLANSSPDSISRFNDGTFSSKSGSDRLDSRSLARLVSRLDNVFSLPWSFVCGARQSIGPVSRGRQHSSLRDLGARGICQAYVAGDIEVRDRIRIIRDMNINHIEILRPGHESKLELYLRPRLSSSMFLLNNLRRSGLVDTGKRFAGTYAALFAEGEIHGVVALYWNGMLVLQVEEDPGPLIAAIRKASDRPLTGLVGPRHQVDAAISHLEIKPGRMRLDEVEGLYQLELDLLRVPSALADERWTGRRIRPEDVELMTAWRVDYNIEALNEQDSHALRDRIRTYLEYAVDNRRFWVLEVDGQPVSSSGVNAVIDEAVQIGGVWTPPEFRRRGYARAAVAASLLDFRAQGVEKAILFTGDENLPAIKAYKALGFRRVGDFRLVLLQEEITE